MSAIPSACVEIGKRISRQIALAIIVREEPKVGSSCHELDGCKIMDISAIDSAKTSISRLTIMTGRSRFDGIAGDNPVGGGVVLFSPPGTFNG